MSKESHLERTSNEPRDPSLHPVILKKITQINPFIRLFRLEMPSDQTIKLDVYLPTVPKAGGFTITSPPSAAKHRPSSPGYLELAVQKSPDNPPAAFLWRPAASILNTKLTVRVGGSFVWPPPDVFPVRRVVFVAGGVGVNPLMSMLSQIAEEVLAGEGLEVCLLYSMRDPGKGKRNSEEMLFLERIVNIFNRELRFTGPFKLFLTSGPRKGEDGDEEDVVQCNEVDVPFERRRISIEDVTEAVGKYKDEAVVYVCGVPTMTDSFVEQLTSGDINMHPSRVLCEKWW